ncbi:hypothetical protein F4813DRAFT_400872 [Daldinia decipiens]|uniref:uncharacterized protein n=1 Tax=Daldinia decipiens TaxID=326647 RepID=UPI0020C1CC67|nr:uncharacterized protein F4813DRAFT_400872 [Daldinia decipiens]KAI1652669.1 hypothetical protein F4813DRAFT_400872 [Daldinia decipiens]
MNSILQQPALEIENPNYNDIAVCVVCGGICTPTVPSALSGDVQGRDWMHPWLVKAETGYLERRRDAKYARSSRCQEADPIKLFEVLKFRGGGGGFNLRGGESVKIDTSDVEMYIPIHYACFGLAERFCQFRTSCDFNFIKFSRRSNQYRVPSRIGHFYEIWMQRARMTEPGSKGVLHSPIRERKSYLGVMFATRLEVYNAYIDHGRLGTPVQEADPSANKMRTTLIILSRLVRLDKRSGMPSPEYRTLRHVMESHLPGEIKEMIFDKLEPFHNLSHRQLACTRVLLPEWWMDELLSGRLIPWLFDIDKSYLFIVDLRFRTERPGEHFDINNDLDWELLCRQLGQRRLFEPGDILFGVKELENRWHIWCLLDNALLESGFPVGRLF